MDILEPKNERDLLYKVKEIRDILKFGKNKINLNGSAGLKAQYYFSDYDFSVSLNKLDKSDYYEFERILTDIDNNNFLYFIELKIQLLNGRKIRCHTINKFTDKIFNKHYLDVDFIKIDIVAWLDGRFTEMSCIYAVNNKNDNADLMGSLKDDIKELTKEGKYYKVLKRFFNIQKIKGKYRHKKKLVLLTRFFNSEYGVIYRDIANVEACKLIFKKYKDNLTQYRIKSNLHVLGIKDNTRNMNVYIKKQSSIINNVAKQILENVL
jgi:hypothetical protein